MHNSLCTEFSHVWTVPLKCTGSFFCAIVAQTSRGENRAITCLFVHWAIKAVADRHMVRWSKKYAALQRSYCSACQCKLTVLFGVQRSLTGLKNMRLLFSCRQPIIAVCLWLATSSTPLTWLATKSKPIAWGGVFVTGNQRRAVLIGRQQLQKGFVLKWQKQF